jgi:drug/metabolite transporter (DMT)-like permease
MTTVQFSKFLLLAGLFGSSFLFMKIASPEFGATPLIALRLMVAAVLLQLLFPLKKQDYSWENIRHFLFLGCVNAAIPFSLFAYAAPTLPAGFSSLSNITVPLWSTALAFWWFDEKLTWKKTSGLIFGMVGVVILLLSKPTILASVTHFLQQEQGINGGNSENVGNNSNELIAMLLCCIACFGYALSANYTRKYVKHLSPQTISTGSQTFGTLALIPFALWNLPTSLPSTNAFLCVGALGVLCTALAISILYQLVHEIGASKMVFMTFLVPVFATFWGCLFLGETIQLMTLVGASFASFGVFLVLK